MASTTSGDEGKDGTESAVLEIQKKIIDAFDIFDHDSSKIVDIKEVGTIIRSLGCCPSEAELHDMLTEMEQEETAGNIRLEDFLPVMTNVLMERRYKPATEDKLIKAFKVLDVEKNGHLTQEELTKYMTEEGEPFTAEELEEMMITAVDPKRQVIIYKDFVPTMTIEET